RRMAGEAAAPLIGPGRTLSPIVPAVEMETAVTVDGGEENLFDTAMPPAPHLLLQPKAVPSNLLQPLLHHPAFNDQKDGHWGGLGTLERKKIFLGYRLLSLLGKDAQLSRCFQNGKFHVGDIVDALFPELRHQIIQIVSISGHLPHLDPAVFDQHRGPAVDEMPNGP